MHLGRNNPNYTYSIGGDQLHSVKEQQGPWSVNGFRSSHTSAVANKANQLLGLIKKSFTNLNEHIPFPYFINL